jgi:serine/threonine protein kinase
MTSRGRRCILKSAMGLGIDLAAGAPKRRVVGCYEILAALGRGGMGEVFHARDLRLGRSVALKFLPQSSAPDRAAPDRIAIDRFFLEARAASALNHPNIVTIYDIGDADGVPFIAMELIQGRTVRAIASESHENWPIFTHYNGCPTTFRCVNNVGMGESVAFEWLNNCWETALIHEGQIGLQAIPSAGCDCEVAPFLQL